MTCSLRKTDMVAVVTLLVGGTSGCAVSPQVVFIQAAASRVEQEGRLHELTFRAGFTATELAGEELLYQVQLYDRARQWVQPSGGRYRTQSGAVGATKTLFVFSSEETFRDVMVSIPADEIHLTPETVLPIRAAMRVYRLDGKCMASAVCNVPITHADRAPPPLVLKPAEAPTYWFVKPAPDRVALPILCGPYASAEEAAAAVPAAKDPPMRLRVDDPAWFVSMWTLDDPDQIVWCGPCEREEDAWKLNAELRSCGLWERNLEVGHPMVLSLEYALTQRTDLSFWDLLVSECCSP